MNAIFIMVATVAILGLAVGLFGYFRLLRLHKLIALSNKHISTDNLDAIYTTTILVGGLLFIICSMVCIGTWQTAEYKYQDCVHKTQDTVYCSKYLKD